MFNRIIRGLVTAFAFWLVNRYRRLSVDLVKLEAAGYYLKCIQAGRRSFISVLLIWLGVFFFALGIILFHAGLFVGIYLLTQNMRAVAIGLLGLGGIYVIVILLVVGRVLSEAAWMKFFKADKLVAELTKKT